MEKKIYEILSSKTQNAYENQKLIEFMTQKFFKPLITPLPIVQILRNIKVHEWSPQTTICKEGQKIDSYFFLLEGCVNVYKKSIVNEKESSLEIVKNISEPSLISDSLFSQHTNRSYTVITSDSTSQLSRGFSIKKQIIEQHCTNLIKQHKILKTYFCSFLNISSDRFYKIDLYENILFKTYTYGQRIKLKNEILIIYSGECMMSFQEIVEKRKANDSPFKTSNQKSHKYRPLIKLCQNECLGMEMMFPPVGQNIYKFKYVVTNEKMVGISIAFDKLANFPKELNQKIKQTHDYHMKKLQENIFYQNLSQMSNQSKITQSISINSFANRTQEQSSFIQQKSASTQKARTQQFNQTNLQRSGSSIHTLTKSRFILPNAKSTGQLPKIRQVPNFNQTNVKNNSSSFKVNQNEAFQLKKKFCIGFELKSRCQKEELNTPKVSPQKQVIKQPKGYFSFMREKKQQKENKNNMSITKGVSPLGKNKDWSCYLKLPKLL